MTKKVTVSMANKRMHAAQKAGGGILVARMVTRDMTLGLVMQASLGDVDAHDLFDSVDEVLKTQKNSKAMCLLCDDLPPPETIEAIIFLDGDGARPGSGVIMVVCGKCFARHGSSHEVGKAAMEKILAGFTGGRALDVHPGIGRA